MPDILFTSTKFPGIALFCPVKPDPTEKQGTFHFSCGIRYTVTEETLEAIRDQLAQAPNPVSEAISLQVYGSSTVKAAKKAVLEKVTVVDDEPSLAIDLEDEDDIPTEIEPFELTEEDEELIEIEISKLKGKTVAKAEPLLSAIALNTDLHSELRKLYLERVLKSEDLQKSLKDTAKEALQLLQ